jgi:diadenylate cyclase
MGSLDLFGFLPFGFMDLVDIVLVAFLLFKLYELIKGTIAIRIFFGVISIYIIWLVVVALQMELMSQILRQFINVGVIALIIVFQQEIRRFLLAIGNSGFFQSIGVNGGLWTWLGKEEKKLTLNLHALSQAIFNMASTKTGALVVIERQANLQSIIDSGKKLNADISAAILESIFFKNSPLHDGAVIIRGNKLVAASSMLPLTQKRGLPDSYGMRHKAALGLTEDFDAICITVSEETGEIGIAYKNSFDSYADISEFRNRIQQIFAQD